MFMEDNCETISWGLSPPTSYIASSCVHKHIVSVNTDGNP